MLRNYYVMLLEQEFAEGQKPGGGAKYLFRKMLQKTFL